MELHSTGTQRRSDMSRKNRISPEFDPSKPFEAVEPAAPAFDPSQPFESGDGEPSDFGAEARTTLDNAANFLLAGHLPHVQAAVGQLMPDPNRDLDLKLKRQGFKIQENKPGYIEERDRGISRLAQESEDNPKSAALGKALGFGLSLPTYSSKLPKALGGYSLLPKALGGGAAAKTIGGRIIQGGKVGAMMGAIQNPGDIEGQVAGLEEIAARGKQGIVGGLVGAGTSAVLEAAPPLFKYVKGKLGEKAEEKAVHALNPTAKQLRDLESRGKVNELGRELLDEGVIPKTGSVRAIADRLQEQKEAIGDKIGTLISKAGDKRVIDSKQIASRLENSAEFAVKNVPGSEGASERGLALLDTLRANGKMSVKQAHDLRRDIDGNIWKANSGDVTFTPIKEMLYAIRNSLNDAIGDGIEKIGARGATKDRLLQLNKSYSNMASASKIAEMGAGRAGANRTFSLSDTIMTSGGISNGDLSFGMVAGLLNKLARTYGRAAAANILDAASKAAGGMGQKAAFLAMSPAVRAGIGAAGAQLPANEVIDGSSKLMDSVLSPAKSFINTQSAPPTRAPSKADDKKKKGK